MGFSTLCILVLLALSGEPAWAQEVSSGAPGPAAPNETDADRQERPEADFNFRDPFQSFFPFDVVQREEMEEPAWMNEQGEPVPEEEVLHVEQFKVTGLVWGIEEARAIIDDQVLGVGDTIKGAEIVRIDREGILFDFHGRAYLLKRKL